MANLNDLNEEQRSQEISTFYYFQNARSNMYNKSCTNISYHAKSLWFDMTNLLTILSFMYPTVWFIVF